MNLTIKNLNFPAGFILLASLLFISNQAFSQDGKNTVKIETYDSRVVVFAYSRSDFFTDKMTSSRKEGEEIMKSGDSAKKMQNAYKMITLQFLLHQMVFSTGSSASILSLIKDKLAVLAKEKGVSIIVSKGELTFADPSVEIIDLTMPVAQLFNPKENIESMAVNIRKETPLQPEDFTIEEVIQMWKGFESKNFPGKSK